jgi:hypothetical protein
MVNFVVGTSDVVKAIINPGPNGVTNMPHMHITTFIHDEDECNHSVSTATLCATTVLTVMLIFR